ncbi:lytic transglycosylase domain-containing protein [Achromobacter denitrificans]|jgi:soluble lytic murein transglycosylase-like protein|uniref:Lytic transglycosylase domain-containing protein n=1 Tax=Achromobacter denitrificans TaxID=32002 RepID=A0A3R9MJH0_ACHDE|nr:MULTISPECIES: lytic transglycosylase domain-containing protein [Achromobacter]ASC64155.1 lytic transglycosylase [Achromobacter denitrificans]MBV2157779.1 lytic transglycosylase domain-containing protein [Achromobacter denitrificans]MDF3846694.1 lytic transglycosylase domain-containing protein [Achromobacter denitrificans]MDF3856934.1 lytic transglycosylase domain-containing protein [Achromobacter denitrificans]MDF3943515.1 lytic transglycosylase domain-containing protein [Achromobacter deni
MHCHAHSIFPALRAFLARAGSMAALAAFVAGALALAPARPAEAADIYRYKDPFGVWRAMKVPTGHAKYYKRAQARAAWRGGGVKVCLSCDPKSGDGARLASLDPTPRALRWGEAKPPTTHDGLIARAAQDSGVDQALLTAVIAIESGFRSDARSPKGALGLMQLMPATAAPLLAVDDVETALVDPATNVRAGSRHLRRLIDQYPGRLDLALAAYNAGEGAVRKYDAVPPYAETQAYVRDVTALYEHYKAP